MDCDNWVVIKIDGDDTHYRVLAVLNKQQEEKPYD